MKYIERRTKITKEFLLSRTIHHISGCIVWTGASDAEGYGMIYTHRLPGTKKVKWARVPRLMYLLHYGVHPGKLCVCHKCDNPRCINPDHLFLGTPADNARDMASKGRNKGINAGQRNGSSVIKNKDIPIILKLLNVGIPMSKIGKLYGVSAATICEIKSGKRWSSITGITNHESRSQ